MDANTEFIEAENRMLRTELRNMKRLLAAIIRFQPPGEIRIDDRALARVDHTSIEIIRDDRRMETIVKLA